MLLMLMFCRYADAAMPPRAAAAVSMISYFHAAAGAYALNR